MKILTKLLTASYFLVISTISFAANNVAGFDFDYSVDYNKSIGLTQVFDDGERTFFQFTQSDKLPTIYTVKDGKKILANGVEARPPYLIVPFVDKKFVLTINKGKTTIGVSYNGSRDEQKEAQAPTTQAQTSTNSAQNNKQVTTVQTQEFQDGSVTVKKTIGKAPETSPTQAKNEQVKKPKKNIVTATLLNVPFFENSVDLSKKTKRDFLNESDELTSAHKVLVKGRPSVKGDTAIAETRSLAIKNMLIDMGVSEDVIETSKVDEVKKGRNEGFYLSEIILLPVSDNEVQSEVKKVKPKEIWEINIEDRTLEASLNKWALKAGFQSFIWELDDEILITSNAKFEGTFDQALNQVLTSLKTSDTPIKAKYYANNVIRIMPLNKGNKQ